MVWKMRFAHFPHHLLLSRAAKPREHPAREGEDSENQARSKRTLDMQLYQRPANSGQSCRDVLIIHAIMGDGPNPALANVTHQHAMFLRFCQELHRLGLGQWLLL